MLGKRRSWLLSFSDILLQLLAFFIMRYAITPHPPKAVISSPVSEAEQLPITPKNKNAREMRLLKFRNSGTGGTSTAEVLAADLPTIPDDLSFSLKEDLTTLSLTFGEGKYLFEVSELRCAQGDGRLSPQARILVDSLVESGVSESCVQLSQTQFSATPCDGPKADKVVVLMRHRECEPFPM